MLHADQSNFDKLSEQSTFHLFLPAQIDFFEVLLQSVLHTKRSNVMKVELSSNLREVVFGGTTSKNRAAPVIDS